MVIHQWNIKISYRLKGFQFRNVSFDFLWNHIYRGDVYLQEKVGETLWTYIDVHFYVSNMSKQLSNVRLDMLLSSACCNMRIHLFCYEVK